MINFIGLYLLGRNIFLFTYCFFRNPGGVKTYKKLKVNFKKRRERELMSITLDDSEKLYLKNLKSDYVSLERDPTFNKEGPKFCKICQ
jgi:hypothetical protein